MSSTVRLCEIVNIRSEWSTWHCVAQGLHDPVFTLLMPCLVLIPDGMDSYMPQQLMTDEKRKTNLIFVFRTNVDVPN
jgi:hypothetical protein